MWIEIKAKQDDGSFHELINMESITHVSLNNLWVDICSVPSVFRKIWFNDHDTAKAFYEGIKLGLQGQETTYEGIGFIKPLLNEQREQLHKYLMYK